MVDLSERESRLWGERGEVVQTQNLNIHMSFGCQSSIIDTSVDIHIDIHARRICNEYPFTINIHEWISMFLWISVFK